MRAVRLLPVIVSAIVVVAAACVDTSTAPPRQPAPQSVLGARFNWVTQTTCRTWDIIGPDAAGTSVNAFPGGGYIESLTTYSASHVQAVHCYQTEQWEDFNECRTNPSACIVAYPTTDGAEMYMGGGGGYAGGVYVPAPFQLKVSLCNYRLVIDEPEVYTLDSLKTCQRPMTDAERALIVEAVGSYRADTTATSTHFSSQFARNGCASGYRKIPEALAAVDSFQVGRDSIGHGGESAIARRMGHVDPERFNRVVTAQSASYRAQYMRELLRTVLHEVGHAYIPVDHEGETNYPYVADYFSSLNYFGQDNSCIR